MTSKAFISICVFLLASACSASDPATVLGLKDDRITTDGDIANPPARYDYQCLVSSPPAMLALHSHKAEVMAVNMAPGNVSEEEENEYGSLLLDELKEEQEFLDNDDRAAVLKQILEELLAARPEDHRNLDYDIHLVKDDNFNAFTAGGQIYVNTGLIDFCETTSELVCIIAHEIGHNELKHINLTIKRQKVAGQFAGIAMLLKKLTSSSFNQFNELECDVYGAELAYAAGYDSRAAPLLWKRMAEADEGDPNDLFGKFMSTHPYSIERYECLDDYITENHKF